MKKLMTIHYGVHASPFGKYLLATTDKGVCALAFLDKSGAQKVLKQIKKDWPGKEIVRNQFHTEVFAKRIFSSAKRSVSIPFVLHGTDFQIKVWDALSAIPEGETATYQGIAKRIKAPRAVRAVGTACGKNVIAYLVPCHRVLTKHGSIGGYRWGASRKKALLAYESSNVKVRP